MADAEVSLRPLSLRPAGAANPFSNFKTGLGFGRAKHSALVSQPAEEQAPKRNADRIKYPKEFLMKFMNVYTKCPAEVEQLGQSDIVVSGEDQKEAQKEALAKVAEEIDDRDWRTRAPVSAREREFDFMEREPPRVQREPRSEPKPSAPRSDVQAARDEPRDQRPAPKQQEPAQPKPAAAAPAQQGATDQDAAKIVRAADVGRQAYRPGAALTAEERARRSVKGILNKLTPEKFERLLNQLLEVITTADILQDTIVLVFENAVEQPTYCAMYADLCVRLSSELPSFPPPAGSDKPITFKQILLNTCQDEFEGAEEAREKLSTLPAGAEREEAEKTVRKRVTGNMRLITELYKQDMVKDWIVTTCMDELLASRSKKGDAVPPEANIEAVCEMLTVGGGRLSKSDKPETVKRFDKVIKELARLHDSNNGLQSRIKFLIRDILELKKANWIPRKESQTVKKIEEVRAQAEAELGMISSTIAASLPQLPAQQRFEQDREEFMLIPPLRDAAGGFGGAGAPLFPPLRSEQQGGGFAGKSALLGEWTAPAPPRQAPAPAPAAAAPAQAPAYARPPGGKELSEEDLQRKAQSLYDEYCTTLDKAEALTCIGELTAATSKKAKILEFGMEAMMNSLKDKEQDALRELLLAAHAGGLVSSQDFMDALATFTVQLEDLAMDVPKAPALLGNVYGAAVAQGILGLDLLPQLLEGEMGVEPKRRFAATALLLLKSANGDEWLGSECASQGVHAKAFLEADPEFDQDAPPLADFLAAEGLSVVPL